MCVCMYNNNNSLFRHLNNSRNNSLKRNQIITLNKIIIIKDVSSVFCGILKFKAHFSLPGVNLEYTCYGLFQIEAAVYICTCVYVCVGVCLCDILS